MTRTRTAPVSRSNKIDSGDLELPKASEVTMDQRDPLLEGGAVEVADGRLPQSHYDELAFMEELVDVEVQPSDSPTAEPLVEVRNGGVLQIFPRGQVVTCKRKFVEVLARAKPISYKNVEYTKDDGSRDVKWPKTYSLRYPFVVHRDDNPRGREWLRKVMAQA